MVAIGNELRGLHVSYESVEPYDLEWVEKDGTALSYKVERMKIVDGNDVLVNDSLTLRGVPSEAHEFRLGNRSALEWIVDQYRVERDADGKVLSDPNRDNDPEYIVRLIGQVVSVSLNTARLVRSLSGLAVSDFDHGN